MHLINQFVKINEKFAITLINITCEKLEKLKRSCLCVKLKSVLQFLVEPNTTTTGEKKYLNE